MQTATTGSPHVRPYNGTVTAQFSDALLASTKNALVIEDVEGKQFLFPFEDIYFDFMSRSSSRPQGAGSDRDWWDVSAVGEAHRHIMWVVNATAADYGRLQGYGCFDPKAVRIEANPEQHGEDSTDLP